MFCKKCGKQLTEGAQFCEYCAAPASQFMETGSDSQINKIVSPATIDNKPQMRKIFNYLLPLAMVFCLAGCGEKTAESPVEPIESPVAVDQDDVTPIEEPDDISIDETGYSSLKRIKDVTSFRPANDGYYWIGFLNEEDEEFVGLVNSDNSMLLYYKNPDILSGEIVDDKYFYVDYKLYDFDGNKLGIAKKIDGVIPKYLSFGGGYSLVEYHFADFDNNYYEYKIVDIDGNEIYDLYQSTTNKEYKTKLYGSSYIGGGIFSIMPECKKGTGSKAGFFDAENKVSIPEQIFDEGDYHLYYQDEDTVLNTDVLNSDKGNGRYFIGHIVDDTNDCFTFIDKANPQKQDWMSYRAEYIYDISIPNEIPSRGLEVLQVSGDYLLWRNYYDKAWGLLDISSGEFKTYNGKYADKIFWDEYFIRVKQFEGTIALPLVGADEKNYVVLIDKNMNEICEPIFGEKFWLGDGYLVTDHGAYDLQGNLIRSSVPIRIDNVYSCGLGTIIEYRDTDALHYESYRMIDGTLPDWNQIDISKAKEISLSN